MPSVKVLTIQMLRQLNNRAIRARANRTINPTALALMSSDNIYPISTTFLHNDRDVRCRIIVNAKGDAVELDMTLNDYSRIPAVELPTEETPCDDSNASNATPDSPPVVEATSSVPSSPPRSVPARPRRNASGRGAAARPTSPRARKRTKST